MEKYKESVVSLSKVKTINLIHRIQPTCRPIGQESAASQTMALDDKAGYMHHDHELALAAEKVNGIDPILPEYVEGTPEERALVRKIDFRLIPILWLM